MNSPERQNLEPHPRFYYSETESEFGISLMIQESLLERIEDIYFYHEEIDDWLRSKGDLVSQLQPLIIALIDRDNPLERNGSRTRADYITRDGNSLVRVYMRDRILEFDMYADEFDHEVREDNFNYELNKSCIHEIEHWVQRSNGQTDPVFREGILEIRKNFETDMNAVGENKAGEIALKRLVQLILCEDDFETYFNRPTEIQAREASDIYPSQHGPMIWCKLKSKH